MDLSCETLNEYWNDGPNVLRLKCSMYFRNLKSLPRVEGDFLSGNKTITGGAK